MSFELRLSTSAWTIAVALVVAGSLVASPTTALEGAAGSHDNDLFLDEAGRFAPFPAKSASEIMSADEFGRYDAALAALRCDEAAQILNRAFVDEYPQFSAALWDEDEAHDWNYALWDQFARVRYDEFGYCRGVRSLEEAQEELEGTGDAAAPYRWSYPAHETSYDNPVLKLRDTALAVVITKAMNDFIPALRKLDELLADGEMFGAMPEAEYFVLRRLCALGVGCADSGGRIEALAQRIVAVRRRSLEEEASAGGSGLGAFFGLGVAP